MAIWFVLIGIVFALPGCAGTSTAKKSPVEPVYGFVEVGEHTCFAAPLTGELSATDERRVKRESLSSAMSHWRGEVDPSIKFGAGALSELEDRLMNHPEDLPVILEENLALCRSLGAGEIDVDVYEAKVLSFARGVDKGRCNPQLYGLYSKNLSVTESWQGGLTLCTGQAVKIKMSEGKYTIYPEVEGQETRWMGASGDPETSLDTGSYPCTVEGCAPGMVVGRFVPWEGEEVIFPVGMELIYRAPSPGELYVGVNDNDYADNRFMERDQLLDFLVLEITAAQ